MGILRAESLAHPMVNPLDFALLWAGQVHAVESTASLISGEP